ncbi:tyrosine-type recombinase/integrase [Microvirga sp. VF16]|uniref:tyrosine-type recombinase/integrase n=1 Tax=Microvirga sp. VF16 TaxID=2807101 RepID=UPI001FEE4117|nr:tyrosine-type recombinase/integrase [Microvirga sp. VF16]
MSYGLPGGWERIAERAKFTDVTPHTLRHSFASVAGDLGFTESTIAAMLGHAAGSVTSRYVHHLDRASDEKSDPVSSAFQQSRSQTRSRWRCVHLTVRRASVLIAAADKVARAIYAQMTGEEGKIVQLSSRAAR